MSRDKIFVDTGGWIALLNANDQHHKMAVDYYRNLSPALLKVTSSHVVSETFTWLRYKVGFRHASLFLDVLRRAQHSQYLELMFDQPDDHEQVVQLLQDFSDQKLSYTDALSFILMKNGSIHTVFGFDQHFYLMKFEMNP